ncbi:MAG: glycoside hydrolase [Bacteroidales bacterium]|nr:glycoside hydrolase [Bacteroidales bacterium]MCF8344326.1 glycoside hydrolase [Bacteroidales bacterium]MCF8349740.1 glycoside hydrolase [Bacteroidales bacterium]MCF8377824.1 glycoside hydrolase [Bacteroidales bacterium]
MKTPAIILLIFFMNFSLQNSFSQNIDWGDAPDTPYPTLSASNGAQHMITPGMQLGWGVDAESDGQPGWNAMGDDLSLNDDADGVVFTSWLVAGQNATVTVIASGGMLLNAWVDFNVDGDWADAGEQIFTNVILANGYNQLSFSVPPGTPTGAQTFARFRASTQGGIGFTGFAPDGEVEDYQLMLGMPNIDDVIIDPNPCMTLTQNEISLAIDQGELFGSPILLIAAYNDDPHPGGPGLGISYSTDAGASWGSTQLGYPWNPYANAPMVDAFDPSIAVDDSGHVFASYIATDGNLFGGAASGLYIQKSTDGGISWSPAKTISIKGPPSGSQDTSYRFNDRQQIITDKYSQSPFYNHVYLTWIMDRGWNVGQPLSDIYFSSSSDGGEVFSQPLRINSWANNMGNMPTLDVAKNGTVYVCWMDYNVSSGGQGTIFLDKSTDAGLNWGQDKAVYTVDLPPLNLNNGSDVRAKGAAVIRVLPSDPDVLFIVFAEDPDGTGPDEADIFMIKSEDGGDNWGNPSRVNDDQTNNDQVMPWMFIKANDIIDIIWYDRRNDPTDLTWDVYYCSSTDEGNTFSNNIPVNGNSFISPSPHKTNDEWMGEYPALVADYNDAFMVYTTSFLDGIGDVAFTLAPNPDAEYDWGDAPEPDYPTKSLEHGAAHKLEAGVYLGQFVDAEPDGIPDPLAEGDDQYDIADEDGVIFPDDLYQGMTDTLIVSASAAGYLNAWIDFNANGDWSDSGDKIFNDEEVAAGENKLYISIPENAVTDTTYARFRLTTYQGIDFTGKAEDGEVEDYMMIITESTAIKSNIKQPGVLIYPHPVQNRFTLSLNLPSKGELLLQFYRMEGSLMKTIHIGELSKGRHSIPMTIGVAAGVYFVKASLSNRILFTKRFVVIR